MPLWLWLLPVPWLAVLAFWAVVALYAARRGRAQDEAREDVERRAEAMLFGYASHAESPDGPPPCPADSAMFPLPKMQEFGGPNGACPLDAQRFNPHVHGRPDQWRT